MRTVHLLLVAIACSVLCGVANAQTIGVNVTAASGRMTGFQGAYRASIMPSTGQTFVASVPGVDKWLTIVYEDLPTRQVVRVLLTEWRAGMNVTSSTRLPLAGGTAATISGAGNSTIAGLGAGIPDGGQITLTITP